MANPLARVIMNNITQRNGIVNTTFRTPNSSSNAPHINNKEEQLLKNIISNSSNNLSSNKVLSTLDNLSSSKILARTSSNKQNDTYQSKSRSVNKIALEDLVKGNKIEKKENNTLRKNGTMMTLNQMADKMKKNTDEKIAAHETKNTVSSVRASVINNFEALIPKVSLNSIGKKGSLLK